MSDPLRSTPTTLGGYQLIERIGAGGMGEVWRGERVGPGTVRRRVAIKRILPEFQKDSGLHGRFLAEAKINARMEHPNVVQVIDFGDQPELFLVLEYVDGAPLSELLGRASRLGGGLPLPAALYLIAEAATGLDYAHRLMSDTGQPLGVVHRDVSPSNVLVSIDGSVKVNDFGVAKAADNRYRTEAGLAVGKLVYMAPEQCAAEAIDHRADVFSLGVVLWELLTLQPLLPRNDPGGAIAALSRCEFRKPSSVAPAVPAGVDAIVMEALAMDRNKRMPSAGRMAKALRTVLASVAPGYDARDIAGVVETLAPEVAARNARADLTRLSTGKHAPVQAAMVHATPVAHAVVRGPEAIAVAETGLARSANSQVPTAGPALAPAATRTSLSAADLAPAAGNKRSRAIRIAAGIAALVLVGGGGIAVGLALSDRGTPDASSPSLASASSSGFASPTPMIAAPPAMAIQNALGTMLPSSIASCAASMGVHGTASIDVAYLPNGIASMVDVRINDMGKDDVPVAQCVHDVLAGTQAAPTPTGITVPTIVMPF